MIGSIKSSLNRHLYPIHIAKKEIIRTTKSLHATRYLIEWKKNIITPITTIEINTVLMNLFFKASWAVVRNERRTSIASTTILALL